MSFLTWIKMAAFMWRQSQWSSSFYFTVCCHAAFARSYYSLFSDEPTGRLALVFELMEMNLYEAIKGRTTYLPESRVKFYIY